MQEELRYRLGANAYIDPGRGTVYRDGLLVLPRPKTFELLAYLVRNPSRVIGKGELLDAIWPATTVTEGSLAQCIRDARRCIGDDRQDMIRTVPRRGYLFQPPRETDLPIAPAASSHVAGLRGKRIGFGRRQDG